MPAWPCKGWHCLADAQGAIPQAPKFLSHSCFMTCQSAEPCGSTALDGSSCATAGLGLPDMSSHLHFQPRSSLLRLRSPHARPPVLKDVCLERTDLMARDKHDINKEKCTSLFMHLQDSCQAGLYHVKRTPPPAELDVYKSQMDYQKSRLIILSTISCPD